MKEAKLFVNHYSQLFKKYFLPILIESWNLNSPLRSPGVRARVDRLLLDLFGEALENQRPQRPAGLLPEVQGHQLLPHGHFRRTTSRRGLHLPEAQPSLVPARQQVRFKPGTAG